MLIDLLRGLKLYLESCGLNIRIVIKNPLKSKLKSMAALHYCMSVDESNRSISGVGENHLCAFKTSNTLS